MDSEYDVLAYEKHYREMGCNLICGVDEAGRGPLAGPVCAAAVILPEGLIIEGVNDSKKLSEKKREELFDVIKEKSVAWSVAWASVEEIDEINILQATMLAMKRAIAGLDPEPDFALIDGNKIPSCDTPCYAIVKGDSLSHSIAAASILAKVSRDRLMLELAEKYPQYHFEKHKGYGTKLHTDAILEYGPCEIHRRTFLRKLNGRKEPTDKQKMGRLGEDIVLKYLNDCGYETVARNYRCPYGEIDLIVKNDKYIVFTEVKTRNDHPLVSPKSAVTKSKQNKIFETAQCFLREYKTDLHCRYDVAEVTIYPQTDIPYINYIKSAF